MHKITLIGPRSVGKTTVGKLLAKKLHVKYFDFDGYVENKLNGIDLHIKKYGADSYRKEESKILVKFLSKLPNQFVISAGGGTVVSQLKKISQENVKKLKKRSKIVYLAAESTKILHQREKKRKGNKPFSETKKLFELRKPVYERIYDIKILAKNKPAKKIVEEIMTKI